MSSRWETLLASRRHRQCHVCHIQDIVMMRGGGPEFQSPAFHSQSLDSHQLHVSCSRASASPPPSRSPSGSAPPEVPARSPTQPTGAILTAIHASAQAAGSQEPLVETSNTYATMTNRRLKRAILQREYGQCCGRL
jgi:hypothetical protein